MSCATPHRVIPSPVEVGRRTSARAARGGAPAPDACGSSARRRRHRLADGTTYAGSSAPSSNSHQGIHPAVRNAVGGDAACFTSDLELEDRGPLGSGRAGSIEEQPEQFGRDTERWIRDDSIRILRQSQATDVGLDHPHPGVRSSRLRTSLRSDRPTPDPVRPPTPLPPSARSVRVSAPLPAPTSTTRSSGTESEPADPAIDQRPVNEEVLTERAPPLVPFGPAKSPGHGPSPSVACRRRYKGGGSVSKGVYVRTAR